jgi:hypothetical protein
MMASDLLPPLLLSASSILLLTQPAQARACVKPVSATGMMVSDPRQAAVPVQPSMSRSVMQAGATSGANVQGAAR